MYSMEVCVSTVSIIVRDDALGVPFGGITHNCCIIDAKLFSG